MDRNFLFAMILCGVVMFLHVFYSRQVDTVRQLEELQRKKQEQATGPGNPTGTGRTGNSGAGETLTTGSPPPPVNLGSATEPGADPAAAAAKTGPVWAEFPAATRFLTSDVLRVTLDAMGASVTRVELLEYFNELEEGSGEPLSLCSRELASGRAFVVQVPGLPLDTLNWEVLPSSRPGELAFRLPLPDGTGQFIKRYRLDPETYLLTVEIEWPAGVMEDGENLQYRFLGPERIRFDTGGFARPNQQVTGYPNTRTGENDSKFFSARKLGSLGMCKQTT